MKKKMPKLGQVGDYGVAIEEMNGYHEFVTSLHKLYQENKHLNPIFLHYVVMTESNEEHLMEILDSGRRDDDRVQESAQ